MKEIRVLVKPGAAGWLVESPEGETLFAKKSDAVRAARSISRQLPGMSVLIVLRSDNSVESATSHGAERPPVRSFLHIPNRIAGSNSPT